MSGSGDISGWMRVAQATFVASPVAAIGAVVVAVVAIWLVHKVVYNLLVSPLARFPGPKLWAISRIPSQVSVLRGYTHLDITALHHKYGPVVRIGPNELAFNTPQAFRDIYGSQPGRQPFAKDRSHYVYPPNGVDHLVSAVDDATHARHRRLLAPAFSSRSLKEQEPLVLKYIDLLIERIRRQVQNSQDKLEGATLDIKSWLNYTTFDITGDLMFGESFDCLTNGELHPWIQLIFNSIKAISLMGAVNQFPMLNAVFTSMLPKSVIQQGVDHFNLGASKVDRRLEKGSSRPDFLSAVLKNGLGEQEGNYEEFDRMMSRAEIHSNAFIIIIAGSETSATILSGCIFFLSKDDIVMKRLVKEIRSAFKSDHQITISSSANLTYLNAVIEESLRMYPPFVTSLARTPPSSGAYVDGHWIPKNTTVACHHYASYHSSSNFKAANEFIPERWLGTDSQFSADKKDVLQPFSLGPRGCIGKQLAYAEIRLILCKLLFNFDIQLCSESESWTDQQVFFLWDKPPLMVRLCEREKS